ncbi:ornithine carbamoyltransferase [Acidocella aminolytica]|jgi:ornithine carbamoyltransferase|uniref:Ornithine carbamoyltransferase n=1 Tax=Acidocella aminolytica 101 = DSM 11237 TaxID=1120923 RepID=A0A0D6PLI1_9PROT|nr:ornithine carbamoyltransferase [Acidocella aminolytica]GAN81619.1 aspartate/ornithine carbamoyltransferase [Acidocella aminolytica 101 = DSM 11237]GBQ36540.1 ornithine carbamoyltransferase [Acidocella aminolytica 101 = DSM 11237]SHF26259.1 ornithine carbamoyltransferase [Acidocella aminolytica 101 = DSM 11237]
MSHLRGRSVLSLENFSQSEILDLLKLGAELKAAKRGGFEVARLTGKTIALIFEKDSTRTRSGFEVAAYDQGAHVTYMGPSGSHIGHKESVKDTARVLGRMFDAIEFRGFAQEDAETLAQYSGVPVYNGLTDDAHPTQVLADFMTMPEFCNKPLPDISFAFMGDGGNNMALSLAMGAAKLGMKMCVGAPEVLWPAQEVINRIKTVAAESGGQISFESDPQRAVKGADFLYTDVWLSMGEDEQLWGERIKQLMPYQINTALMAATGNPAAKFMHCLPAFHNTETSVGRDIEKRFGISAMEVSEEVFESERSIVFDQAENRMHSIKAILVATLG